MSAKQLLRAHLCGAKCHVVAVVMRPITILENPTGGKQLLVQRCASKWREDAQKGNVNADVVEPISGGKNRVGSLIVEARDESSHDADPSIMETGYGLAVFPGVILKFPDTAQIAIIQALDANENSYAARTLHKIQQFRVSNDIDGGLR